MEIPCPQCAQPITVPEQAGDDTSTAPASIECPHCGIVTLDGAPGRTVTFRPSAEDAQCKQIAHFTLLKKLGKGGYGTVWLAQDLALGRKVALKLPASEGREASNLIHEARTAASLRHPNIVSIFEVGSEDDRAFIASEFIDGLTLHDFLSAGRPPIPRVVEMLISVAQALHHAHERGVVHRDVKPSNILLNREGQPFVADFGIAKRIHADETISSDGQVIGTARYMSPEQASGKTRETDRRSDIYSLGVILFEMLTGDTPFRGNVRALLHQKTVEEAPSPRRLDPALPKDLETICLRCLEREPHKRYPTASDVAEELKRFSSGEPIQARPISTLERFWRRCRRRPVVTSLVAGLFLSLTLGLLGVSFFWLEAKKDAEQTQQSLYRSQMNLAANYLDNGDIGGVRRALDRFGPGTPLSALRGIEWHYFDQVTAPLVEVANQGDVVTAVAVSRDGDLCAACGNDKLIRVWDSKTGELIRTLSLSAGHFNSLAFSPISTQLAAGSNDGMLRVWNPLQDDRPLQQIKHGPPVALVRYAPNGKRLLTAGQSGAVRVWDLAKESIVAEIPSGMSGMRDARFSPDGEQVAVATGDGGVRVWSVATREIVHRLSPKPEVETMAFSDDGRTIVLGNKSGEVRIWSVADESLQYSHAVRWQIGGLEFVKDSRVLAIASGGGEVRLLDVDTHCELAKLKTHNLSAGVLARSADGKWLAVGSGDGAVRLVRLADLLKPNVFWHEKDVQAVAFLPDGKRVAAAGGDGSLKIWNIETAEAQTVVGSGRPLTTLSIQPGGKLIAVGGGAPTVALWNYDSLELVGNIDVAESGVVAVVFSPSGRRLAAAARAGGILAYEQNDWHTPRWKIDKQEASVSAIAFSADEKALIAAFDNGDVRFFDAATGAASDRAVRVNTIPIALCVCEQGRLLAIGTEAGEIHLWDLVTNQMRHVIKGHSGRIQEMAAMPGGARLVSAGRDHDLKLWHTATGEPITTLAGHVRRVFSVAVSPDGHTLASGGLEGDIRVWRARPGQ